MNKLTKNGLTGDSGFAVCNFPGAWHITANYAARRRGCFVVDKVQGWKRMTLYRARKENHDIISCSYCKYPAISLDHLYPYMNEATHCAKHRNWREIIEARNDYC